MFKMFNINFVKKLHSRGTSHPTFSTANCKRNYPSPFLKLQKLQPACICYKVGRQLKNVQPRRNLPTTFWNEEIAFCKILFFQFVPGQRCSGKWGQKKKELFPEFKCKIVARRVSVRPRCCISARFNLHSPTAGYFYKTE